MPVEIGRSQADPHRVFSAPAAEADLLLEIDRGLTAGYSGFYRCGA